MIYLLLTLEAKSKETVIKYLGGRGVKFREMQREVFGRSGVYVQLGSKRSSDQFLQMNQCSLKSLGVVSITEADAIEWEYLSNGKK